MRYDNNGTVMSMLSWRGKRELGVWVRRKKNGKDELIGNIKAVTMIIDDLVINYKGKKVSQTPKSVYFCNWRGYKTQLGTVSQGIILLY